MCFCLYRDARWQKPVEAGYGDDEAVSVQGLEADWSLGGGGGGGRRAGAAMLVFAGRRAQRAVFAHRVQQVAARDLVQHQVPAPHTTKNNYKIGFWYFFMKAFSIFSTMLIY